MKIYTRTGDSGETGLFGTRTRVPKDDPRVEAYGTVDELNCTLGAVRAALPPTSVLDPVLAGVQSDLFAVGAELATPPSQEAKLAAHMQLALDERTAALEAEIDRLEAELPPRAGAGRRPAASPRPPPPTPSPTPPPPPPAPPFPRRPSGPPRESHRPR